jgi:hypothetical protein
MDRLAGNPNRLERLTRERTFDVHDGGPRNTLVSVMIHESSANLRRVVVTVTGECATGRFRSDNDRAHKPFGRLPLLDLSGLRA